MKFRHHIVKTVIAVIAAIVPTVASAYTLFVEGGYKPPVNVTPEKASGLDQLVVIESGRGLMVFFEEKGLKSAPQWQRFGRMGGGFAEPVAATWDGVSTSVLNNPEGNMGYIVKADDKTYYFWIVDYSTFPMDVSAITRSDESDCDATYLEPEGTAPAIEYFSIDGRRMVINREITIEYQTQEWSEELMDFTNVSVTTTLIDVTAPIRISPPPYCRTQFIMRGDLFLKTWGDQKNVYSPMYEPLAVACQGVAERVNKDESEASNTIPYPNDDSGLGGSAPAIVSFSGYATDAVAHHEWQLSSNPDFEPVDFRFNQQNLDYTFDQEGTLYMRYVASNADGTCEAYSDTFTISIGTSELKCPNAFTPFSSPGVNDEWKVSYRSLVKFSCTIFDRYGTEIIHFTDPSQGWNGTKNGKNVTPGVYYYVIEAEGADGKRYKRSGDINILKYTGLQGSSQESEY